MTQSVGVFVAKLLGRIASTPIRLIGHEREPAVSSPELYKPGDRPPTDGRLLVLYDGGCGICLHSRDVFALLDVTGALADDRIARHDSGLLGAMSEEERYGSFHVIHPDGRVESGGDGFVAVLEHVKIFGPFGRFLRHGPGTLKTINKLYDWFVDNRVTISQITGLTGHPQRDQREQPGEPGHEQVVI